MSQLKDIPDDVTQSLKSQWASPTHSIVDAGEPVQATDQKSDPAMPYRRLAFAALSQGAVYVAYERSGGRGLYWCFVKVERGQTNKVAEAGLTPRALRTVDELQKLLRDADYEKVLFSNGTEPRL